MSNLRSSFGLAMLLLAGPAVARAGEPACDILINSAPYTISAPGHYCLARDVAYASATGNAITIDADQVVLDLRGYAIGGSAGTGTTAVGVRLLNQSNVVVRNGAVRGFYIGIELDGSTVAAGNNKNLVEDIHLDANTRFGVWVSDLGANNTIRGCAITDTGGTTYTTSYTAGLWILSIDSFAFDNAVTGTRPASGGTAVYGLRLVGHGRAVNNQVLNGEGTTNYCFYFSPLVLYKDNIASGCPTAYGGSGTPVGATNYP